MVVKVYISGISGNKEVKKRQQRVLMILDSKGIKYDIIDITEPGKETDKEFMQSNSTSNGGTVSDPNPRSPLPPQLFNDDEYCGDYDQFDLANEVDTLEQFLKVELPPEELPAEEVKVVNGDTEKTEEVEENKASKENSQERETLDAEHSEKEGTAAKQGTLAKEETHSKEGTPAKEGTPSKEGTPAKEGTPDKEGTPTKDATPSREGTSVANKVKSKEGSPAADGDASKEESREATVERQSVEKEAPIEETKTTEVESVIDTEKLSKENTPQRENGSIGSREQSQDKDVDGPIKKENPSEALIQSEQATSAD